MKPDLTLSWTEHGTERILADLARLSDAELETPTLLPGWSRRHLAAHLAANAEALRNLVCWARTGEERRMYASREAREADIVAGSRRPPAELREWVVAASDALAADFATLPDDAWDATIITAQGVTRPASDIPWMRAREVYVHAVDLGAGTGWADLPPRFLAALSEDIAGRRSSAGTGPALAVAATDTGHTWTVTGTGAPSHVSGPLAQVTAYLTGRPVAALATAPELPAWL